jgi:hypothetical protein
MKFSFDIRYSLFDILRFKKKPTNTIGSVPARKTALILFTLTDGLVRFSNYNLYNAGALSSELIACCRKDACKCLTHKSLTIKEQNLC